MRRILALDAALMVAGAEHRVGKIQPPSCNSTIANVVNGDPICELSDIQL
jgi:hypothetical protein